MVHFKERAVFIHVDLLGQEDEAEDLAADCKWPTMQQVREGDYPVGWAKDKFEFEKNFLLFDMLHHFVVASSFPFSGKNIS